MQIDKHTTTKTKFYSRKPKKRLLMVYLIMKSFHIKFRPYFFLKSPIMFIHFLSDGSDHIFRYVRNQPNVFDTPIVPR